MRMRILVAVLLLGLVAGAQAAYPEKPIRFVLPSAAGGSADQGEGAFAVSDGPQYGLGLGLAGELDVSHEHAAGTVDGSRRQLALDPGERQLVGGGHHEPGLFRIPAGHDPHRRRRDRAPAAG